MKLLITLHPLEPFFFGGDHTFAYGETTVQRSGGYFIHSLETPSQTTLLGALRYLGMLKRDASFRLDPSDAARIGPESYGLRSENQSFGMIRGISGLYLMDACRMFYIKTPFDHRMNEKVYTPWEYNGPFLTDCGPRLVPLKEHYSAKEGYADNWLRLNDLSVCDGDCIQSVTRVGVSKSRAIDGFYKKKYRRLEEGFCFAFVAEVEEGFAFPEQTVFLGQKKSAFRARMTPADDANGLLPDLSKLREALHPRAAVALSDICLGGASDAARSLYRHCAFVCAGIREHRSFSTNYNEAAHLARFRKGGELIRLLSAGSVFLVKDETARASFLKTVEDPHARLAGFNQLVYGKEWKVL